VIALLRSELRRFRSRRLVKALAIVALVGIGTTIVILAVRSNPEPPNAFTLGDAREFLEGTASLFAIAGWLIGTSLVGAEWQAGTMSTLLTWEPRRSRVLVAKTIAAVIGVFAMILVLDLLFTGLMTLVAATRGTTEGTDSSLVRSLIGLDVRVATLAAFGAILGLSLATVTRNTGAAVGIAFVYLAIVEGIIRGFLPGWRAWLLGDNSSIFLLAQTDVEIGRSMLSAALVVVVWCSVWLSVATATFLARDVD
jgi:ABC-type transport system involved in multi-copper enzyme maturation permease subunit